MISNIPLSYFLVISTLMFFIGIYGFLTRKNLITILMSIELILNSVNINFVAFNKYLYPGSTARPFLFDVRDCRCRCRSRRGHCHHHQHVPQVTRTSMWKT